LRIEKSQIFNQWARRAQTGSASATAAYRPLVWLSRSAGVAAAADTIARSCYRVAGRALVRCARAKAITARRRRACEASDAKPSQNPPQVPSSRRRAWMCVCGCHASGPAESLAESEREREGSTRSDDEAQGKHGSLFARPCVWLTRLTRGP
jgi:hypothetical protein